jgi:HAD superfamily hydrolase (TIGR01490 family)
MKRVAFFDIDGTLYNGNLGLDVGKYLVGLRLISRMVLLRAIFLGFLYKLRLISYDKFGVLGMSLLEDVLSGKEVERVLRVVEDFYEVTDLNLNKKVLGLLQDLKDKDFFIVLVTGEPDFLMRPFIAKVGADVSLTTELELDKKGKFTGKILENLSTNKGKYEVFKRFVEKEGVDLTESVAVGDSEGDLGMLEACGRAICVNPTRGLLKVARVKGWGVI